MLKKTLTRIENYLEKQKPDKALPLVLSALESEPENPELLLALGEIYDRMGFLKDASAVYQKAAQACPQDPEILYLLGESALMSYQTGLAREVCQTALQIAPGDYRFYMVLADAWLWGISTEEKTGQEREEYLNQAQAAAEQCFKLEVKNGEPYFVKAELALLAGETAQAVALIETALAKGLELYGDYVDLNLALGALNLRLGRLERADEALEIALKLMDDWEEAHFLKTMLFREHCWMIRELYFDRLFTSREIKLHDPEYKKLYRRGFKSQNVSNQVREFFRRIPRYRKHPQEGLEKLEGILAIFEGKLPLCMIFQTIKRPGLLSLFKLYRGDWLEKLGRIREAQKSWREVLELQAQDPAALKRLSRYA